MPPVIVNGEINTRYLSVLQWLVSLGFSKDNIMPTMLASFDPLAAGKNTCFVQFSQKFINVSSISGDPTLNLIGQNDAFVPVGWRQVFRKRVVAATYANCFVVGYPDPFIFDNTGEFDQINSAFNGSRTTVQVETTTVIETSLGRQLSFAGLPQQSATTYSATGSANGFERFVPINKDMLISGLTQFQMQTNLVGFTPATAITGASGEANDIGFELDGYIIKGAGQAVSEMATLQSSKCVIR